ncbi:MAG: histidinol-phosphate transaminase [Clostridia bacterium]|nr:histidinol-phosphate transaminase [Clostridia bacterium]
MSLVREVVKDLKRYVAGKPIDEVKRELGLEEIVKLASNENPFGPSPKAVEAMVQAAPKMHIYPDGNSYYLKEALARELGVNPEQLFLANGSDEVIQMIAVTFVNPGDEAIMATPTFPRYQPTVMMMNGVTHEIPLKDQSHDLEAFGAKINSKTKLIYICNPNNPTGTFVPKGEMDAFMDKVPESAIVVFDEAYFEYVNDPDYPNVLDYLAQGRNVMVMRTFSKMYGLAGLRLGYAATKPELAAAMNRVREPFNVNSMVQAGALAALADKEHVAKVKTANLAGRDYLYKVFTKLGLPYIPTVANFIMVDTGRDSAKVFQALLKKGIIVRSGDIYGYPTSIRVTIGTPEENQKFIAALEEVLAGI